MAGKNGKRKKKRNWFLRVVCLGLILYVTVAFVQLQVELSNRRSELASLNQQIEEQELANQDLKALIDMRQDEEYIERVARERLDYAYPDEKVFIDISGN